SKCGGGWKAQPDGRVDLVVDNTYSEVADVYLADSKTGAVYDELEGLAPGATAKMEATLGAGEYRLQCYTDENNAWLGPVVHVTPGAGAGASTPGVVPVTFAELVPRTIAYQHWIASRLPTLLAQVKALRAAVAAGPTAAAKAAWLKAHLTYETLGAAYGAFGPLDGKINGAPPGNESWRADRELTGFHLLEGLLWSGAPSGELVPAAAQLQHDVEALKVQFVTAEIPPAELPLRAHEIVENAIQFELTASDDEGSHTSLATVGANLEGSAKALGFVAPLLHSRYPQLPATEKALASSRKLVASVVASHPETPLAALPERTREDVDASLENLVEMLAPVAAIGDIRETPASTGGET
ncbi:MAG TPA: EfeM/EfeO family lipoprotein, partial [Solirubrobacterales bacterium]